MPGKGGNPADTKKPDEVGRHLFGGCHMFFCGAAELWCANMYDITQAEPDHLAVHTMERQQGSFLDILGRSELTQSEQARLTVSARVTRLNAERNIILWAGLASGFAGNATRIYLASCRIENIFVRSHAWIMAYIHWQDGEKASDSLK